MSMKQSTRSNSCIPSATDNGDRISNTENATPENFSRKQFVGLTLLTIISVSMIIIGSVYLKHCPAGTYIPVYLLVGGLMGLLVPLLNIQSGRHRDPSSQTVLGQAISANTSKSSSLINCFMLCWFFIGSYWIYSIYKPVYGKDCDKTLYLFAFWLVTSVYLIVAVVFVITLIIVCIKMCAFCVSKLRTKPTETPTNV